MAKWLGAIAVTIVILSLGAAEAGEPPADGRGRELRFELVDGTVITGRTDVKVITIRIPSGNVLKVPVSDLTELSVRPNKQHESVGRAQAKSRIQAREATLFGTVTIKLFRIASPYGRLTVKLKDVHRIRPGSQATPSKLGRLDIELRDSTHLKGMAISRSLRIRTRCGAVAVPLAQMRKATIAADGKNIRVQCWGSDRIVGTLDPETTISLKTDKAKVDLSVGKIAAMFYWPLTLKGHSGGVCSVAFSPDGKRLVSGSEDRTIRLWDTATGTQLLTLKGHSGPVRCVAFSPDGRHLASGSGGTDKTIRIWDTATGTELLAIKGHSNWVCSVAFSPDGKRLASGSYDNTIGIWDTATGKKLYALKGHSDVVRSVAFSPDGRRLASGSQDRTTRLWDTVTGKELLALKGHSAPVLSLAFSPDGKRLASGSQDSTTRLWDTVTGKELLTLKGHSAPALSVAFLPDGKHLASGDRDDIIKIWDSVTGRKLLTRDGHSDGVCSAAFSPDGKRPASGNKDGTIKLWDTLDLTKSPK